MTVRLKNQRGGDASQAMQRRSIQLRGVRVHNLKDIDLDIPLGQKLVICGRSGSGKSSLAFDTLYAEGQRRYVECFSPHTRQFLQRLEKPDAASIDGIPPAVAVRSYRAPPGHRATVGTVTEAIDYLQLWFAKISTVICPACKIAVSKDTPQSAATVVDSIPVGQRLQIGFETQLDGQRQLQATLEWLRREGFLRVVLDGNAIDLSSFALQQETEETVTMLVIVDRLIAGSQDRSRLVDSLETAFNFGNGRCVILCESEAAVAEGELQQIDGRPWMRIRLSEFLQCPRCDREFPQAEPRLFSFNDPLGACAACEGFGSVQALDIDRIVPDKSVSVRAGAIAPWNTPAYAHELQELLAIAEEHHFAADLPFEQLSERDLRLLWHGVPEKEFGGLHGFFRWLERRRYKMHIRVFLNRWRRYETCTDCQGRRLNENALSFRIAGHNIADISQLPCSQALQLLRKVQLEPWQSHVGQEVLDEVLARLKYLCDVGVGYLPISRTLRTLSTGESQRVTLTSVLGSTLVNMLYVLDEPSIGLHLADIGSLNKAVDRLHRRGNTVVIVDHEPQVIQQAQRVLELGPGAGQGGGEVVFDGTVTQLLDADGVLTGDYLAGRRGAVSEPSRRPVTGRGRIRLIGARGHNLRGITVEFPLNVLCVVSGVSGAGKSTLVRHTLYPAIAARLGRRADAPLPFEQLLGVGQIDDCILVDQSPIGRTGRSNPVTFIKAFDGIRQVFADTTDAKTRNIKASRFSFNVDGGRCPECLGEGYLSVDMQFLSDVVLRCTQCDGTRYKPEVLAIQYRGKSIAQVLAMTVREGFMFFRGHPKIQAKLKPLIDVGLDYLQLGQPATVLSSGEAKRLKLASYLASSRRSRTLFILDEPTTGLHMADVTQLLDCCTSLLDVGHSIIMIEHNLQVIQNADYVIDIGPAAADQGGTVVATGSPEEVTQNGGSPTGAWLKQALSSAGNPQ